jgi:cytochrome c-type biogenesis protein CcmE
VTARRKLIIAAAIILAGLGFAAYRGARSSIVYYLTPTEFASRPDLAGSQVRLAGQVAAGSVERVPGEVRFVVADAGARYRVHYTGPLPDLFAEGGQVLVEGRLDSAGWLQASQVITTHPTEYKERYPDRVAP